MTQEVLKLALEFLEDNQHYITDNENHLYLMMYNNVIEKCKEALAQPEQEPVAKYSDIVSDGGLDPRNKFNIPPQRTEQEPVAIRHSFDGYGYKYTDMGFGGNWIGWTKRQYKDSEPLYTHSQRTWVGLTGEEAMDVTRKEGHELLDFIYEYGTGSEGVEERIVAICKAIEAKLKEKNT